MRTTRFPLIRNILALWLALTLGWPTPALALRPRAGGLEEPTATTDALSHELAQAPHAVLNPSAGLEELYDGGVRALAPLFQASPDYSGLATLEAAVRTLQDPAQSLLSESLQRIQMALDVTGRWAAVDEWLRVLNEQVLIPQGRVAAVAFTPAADGGIELASDAYQQFEAIEWWDVEGVRLPVVYVKRLHPPYEATTGCTVPSVVLMNLHAHTIQQNMVLNQWKWGSAADPLRRVLRRLWTTPPRKERMARLLLEETRREELRHLQMMRRTIPMIVQATVHGMPLSKDQVRELLGLRVESPIVGKVIREWRRSTLSAQEAKIMFLQASEIAAVLDRLRRTGGNLWALYDVLRSAAQLSMTPQDRAVKDPSVFRTISLWLVVNHLFHRQQAVAPTPDAQGQVAEILSKLPTDQLAQFASALRESEFRPEAVPPSDPGQQTWPATSTDQEPAMWRLARLVAAGGLEEIQIGEPQPLAGNPAVGQVIPVTVSAEGRWAQGRAVVLDPSRVVIQQFVNPEVNRPEWPGSTIRALPPEQQPGLRLAEMIAKPPRPWGSAPNLMGMPLTPALAVNGLQMNFWERAAFVIKDSKLMAMADARWSEAPWVFVLDVEQSGLRRLPLEEGRPVADGVREAIPGPVLIRGGQDVSAEIRQYHEGQPDPNRVRWDPATTRAAFSALGKTADGRLIWLALGGRDDGHGVGRVSVQDVAQAMRRLGAVEAILLGGSMDVQQWVLDDGAAPGVLGHHFEPPHGAERRLNAAVFVYASARQPDEAFVQRVQVLSDTLRAMIHEVYLEYGAPSRIGIAGVPNPHAPRGGGGISEYLLAAMTSLDVAAAIYAPTGSASGTRGEIGQAASSLKAFLREDHRGGAVTSEFLQHVGTLEDTLSQLWHQLEERQTRNLSPDAGLEERTPTTKALTGELAGTSSAVKLEGHHVYQLATFQIPRESDPAHSSMLIQLVPAINRVLEEHLAWLSIARFFYYGGESRELHVAMQEAVLNAARYGGGGRIAFFRRDDDWLVMQIVDEGPGFADPAGALRASERAHASNQSSGLGMFNIASYPIAHNGQCVVESRGRRWKVVEGANESLRMVKRGRSPVTRGTVVTLSVPMNGWQRPFSATGLEEIPQPTVGELAAWLDQLSPNDGPAYRLYGALKDLQSDERDDVATTVAKAYQVYGTHFRKVVSYLVATRGQGEPERKPDGSLVLSQDKEVQRRSNTLTQQEFPFAAVIGEEGGIAQSSARWWITRDPVDGTTNYGNPRSAPNAAHYLSTLTLSYELGDGRLIPVLTIAVAPEYLDGKPLWLVAGLGIDGVLVNGETVRAGASRPLADLIVGVAHLRENMALNEWYLPAMTKHAKKVIESPDAMAMFEIPLNVANPDLPGALATAATALWDVFSTWHLTEALGGAVLELDAGRQFQPTRALVAQGQAARSPALVYAVSEGAAGEIIGLRRAAGLEELPDPGDPAVPMPDPATATAADVADYLTRRWGVPVRKEGDRYIVDQWAIPAASWTMPEIHDPEPGRIIEDVAAMPVRVPMYPLKDLPTFSVKGTSAHGVYLGFVEGIDHPVVIKITSEAGQWWPGDVDEVVNAQLFGRQGIVPEVYGVIHNAERHRGYVMQIVPGRSPRSENAAMVFAHPDVQAMRRRAGEAGLGLPSVVETVIDRYAGMDAGNAGTLDEDRRTAWIIAQNAGWAIHELQVQSVTPTGKAYVLSNQAALATLALLKLPPDVSLPVVAVVTPAQRERLRAIARQGGFADRLEAWEEEYLVTARADTSEAFQAARVEAETMLARRPGVTDPDVVFVDTLSETEQEFGPVFLRLLSDLGLTPREGWYAEALGDLYRAAQA